MGNYASIGPSLTGEITNISSSLSDEKIVT